MKRKPKVAAKLCVGWVERVSLPDLGLRRVQAKIDTGARTSALHVLSTRPVDTDHRGRVIFEIALPPGTGTSKPRLVRVPVRDRVEVRDTSGHREQRHVIETTMDLGPLRRRIRLSLTDRGDMRYPLLVGRTALGTAAVVDPSRRFVLRKSARF